MIAKRLKMLGVGADIGLTVSLQVVGALVAYAFQIMVLRSLSKEESGIYFLAISYITIASGLADFGLVATIMPRLAVAGGEATPAFKAGFVLRGVMLLVGGALLNVILAVAGKWALLVLVNLAYITSIFGAKATGLRQFLDVLWRLRGRTYVLTAIGVFDTILGVSGLFLLWRYGTPTVTTVTLIFALCNIPGFVVVTVPWISRLRRTGFFRQKIPLRYYRALFLASLPVGLMGALAQVSGQLEPLVLDGFMSKADIAAYTAGTRPLIGLGFVAVTLAFGLSPLVAQHAKGTRTDSSFDFIISVAVRLIGVLGLGICTVCALFSDQIMLIAGREYVADAYILRVFSVINGLTFLVIMFDQFLLAMGRRKQTLYGAILYFALALGLETLIIGQWGIMGMLYAKLAAICCLILFQLYMVGADVRAAAVKALGNLLPAAAVLLVAVILTSGLDLWVRVPVVLVPTLGTLLLMRTVRLDELRALRTMKVT